jgi:hypothetical protein
MPAAPGVSTTGLASLALVYVGNRTPQDGLPLSQYDLPGKFPIFREDSRFKFYL